MKEPQRDAETAKLQISDSHREKLAQLETERHRKVEMHKDIKKKRRREKKARIER